MVGNAGVAMDAGLTPIAPGAGVAGTVLTVRAVPGDNLVVHRAVTMAEPGEGVSVVPAPEREAVLERDREKVGIEADLRERDEGGESLYDIGGYDEHFECLEVVGHEGSVR